MQDLTEAAKVTSASTEQPAIGLFASRWGILRRMAVAFMRPQSYAAPHLDSGQRANVVSPPRSRAQLATRCGNGGSPHDVSPERERTSDTSSAALSLLS